jgi:integrase
VEHFGPDQPIGEITTADAEEWWKALAAGKLSGARAKGWRDTDRPLSGNSMRGFSRDAKVIFGWAKSEGLVHDNPFGDFVSLIVTTKPNHHVTMREFRLLYRAAKDQPWRALFALCRLAGLRRGEALALTWGDVDWQRRRLCLIAAKTGSYREIPMRPLLYRILMRTFEAAPEGTVRVLDAVSFNNLTKYAREAIGRAALAEWPKTFQALRSSCENDFKVRGVAESTYCRWLGHDPTVSRKHYVAPPEAEYARITGLR